MVILKTGQNPKQGVASYSTVEYFELIFWELHENKKIKAKRPNIYFIILKFGLNYSIIIPKYKY